MTARRLPDPDPAQNPIRPGSSVQVLDLVVVAVKTYALYHILSHRLPRLEPVLLSSQNKTLLTGACPSEL